MPVSTLGGNRLLCQMGVLSDRKEFDMERVLLVQVEESAARKIKKLAEAKKISVVYGTKEQGSQIIQDILDGKENPYASENALPRKGLVVFC